MILAGDIGGTKCNLALYETRSGRLHRIAQRRFVSRDYPGIEEIVREFIRETGGAISAAGFCAAGPVVGNTVCVTNLSWVVDGASLGRVLGLERVVLLNDLEATGSGIGALDSSELFPLNPGTRARSANQAVIAPGTGLGIAILFWDGSRHIVSATEGGHADFSPRTDEEIELLRFLKEREGQVSVEVILSGRGFRSVHEFLDANVRHASFDAPEADPAPEITRKALAGECPVCVKTLAMWVEMLGAEAGNLALRTLARGGVYVAGGIAIKILEKLKDGTFVRAFCDKSQHRDLLAQIPIHVVLNEDAPLLGAAVRAAAQVS